MIEGRKSDPGIRNVSSPHWRRWLGRCVVQFSSFSENEPMPDGSRPGRSQKGGNRAYEDRLGNGRSGAVAVIALRARNRPRRAFSLRLWTRNGPSAASPDAHRRPSRPLNPSSCRAPARPPWGRPSMTRECSRQCHPALHGEARLQLQKLGDRCARLCVAPKDSERRQELLAGRNTAVAFEKSRPNAFVLHFRRAVDIGRDPRRC